MELASRWSRNVGYAIVLAVYEASAEPWLSLFLPRAPALGLVAASRWASALYRQLLHGFTPCAF